MGINLDTNQKNYAIGAGVGTAVGAGAGVAAGAIHAGKILKSAHIEKGITKDKFVNSKMAALMKSKSYKNSTDKIAAKTNVKEKATTFFENTMSKIKNTKVKWLAAAAAAGLAIGAGVAFLVNKNAAKAEAEAPKEQAPESKED